ncbi:MAG: multicopper oxidase domain-containing protein [Crocinitomicaceae bacterium]
MKNLLTAKLIFIGGVALAQNQLNIPPTIETSNIDLTLQEGTYEFYPGVVTNTMGANGSLLGPTLIMDQGDQVSITVNNQLQDETTIHWHGMHVSPLNDGGPHTVIQPGSTWNPQFEVMDRAGLNWYHPHLHMMTNEHVSKGIAGMIIVKDAEEAALTLPRDYGVDDFPLVIQTKAFDASGQIVVHSELDTSLMVNGTVDPFLDVPSQVVRFRLLNGSSQRVYKLGFTNNMSFKIIGTDGGLLTAPVDLTRYDLAPGQRADILVDLTGMQGQSISLINYGTEFGNGIYGSATPGMMPQLTLPGYDQNPLNGADFDILNLNIGAQTANPVLTTPTTLVAHNIPVDGTEDANRSLLFTTQQNIVGPFLINGAPFDMNVINYTIPLGNREVWTLTNQTPIGHPFHIHDVQFYILDINGNPPPPELQGLNDVVMVPAGMGTVRFITEFLDFANDTVPYMYHCHMLTHEDDGMMGQFVVSDPNAGLEKIETDNFQLFPNPNNGTFELQLINEQVGEFEILNGAGEYIQSIDVTNGSAKLSLNLSPGIYFISDNRSVEKFIIR